MTLDELDAALRAKGELPEEEEGTAEIDWQDELWETMDLLERVQPLLKSIILRNRKSSFLPKKQRQEFEELHGEIAVYLDGWDFQVK